MIFNTTSLKMYKQIFRCITKLYNVCTKYRSIKCSVKVFIPDAFYSHSSNRTSSILQDLDQKPIPYRSFPRFLHKNVILYILSWSCHYSYFSHLLYSTSFCRFVHKCMFLYSPYYIIKISWTIHFHFYWTNNLGQFWT